MPVNHRQPEVDQSSEAFCVGYIPYVYDILRTNAVILYFKTMLLRKFPEHVCVCVWFGIRHRRIAEAYPLRRGRRSINRALTALSYCVFVIILFFIL